MKQWAQRLLESEPRTEGHVPELRVLWQQQFSGVHLSHGVALDFQGTSDEDVDLEGIWKRLVCHVLIDALPQNGIEEISQSLVQALEFYAERKPPQIAAGVTLVAKVGRAYERQPLVYSED